MRISLILLVMAGQLFAGDLTTRFDLALNRLLEGGPPHYTAEFVLADAVPEHVRRFTDFSGDVSGRYIGALALAEEASGRHFAQLDQVVDQIVKLQKPDGHFGDPLSNGGRVTNGDMAIMWGNGRLLIGLMEYYRGHPRPEVLQVARRLGDFLVNSADRFNADAVRQEYNGTKFAVGYICWTQNIEGLVALWSAAKDARYLALAKELAARTDRHPSQHSHGFLTTLRGIVDLYRATGDRSYLEQAGREWQSLVDSGNLLMQGAVPEMFAPSIKRDEGCSEADWLRLSLDLWRETGDSKYLRQAELALFNEFELNQFSTGDFGHHTLTENGIDGPFARAWWCCTMHGLRALAAVLNCAFHAKEGVIHYDLPVDGVYTDGGFSVRAESSLELDGTVRLTIASTDGKPRTISIRQPDWASAVSYRGESRAWKKGDTIVVRYSMRTRVLRSKGGPARAAVFHGPWLLGVDMHSSPNYFDEPSTQNRVLLPAGDAITLEPVRKDRVAYFRLKYLPGGYPVQPAEAVLRPIAELTHGPDSNRVDWWLPVTRTQEKQDSTYTQ